MLTRLLAFVALASSFIPASFAQQGVAQGQGTAQGAGQIYVGPPTPPATVTIAPASQVLATSTTQNFVATVINDSFNQGVNWTLSGPGCSGATCGTLSATTSKSTVPITYTAPASAPSPNAVVLTATSILNPGGFANANITITSAPPPIVVGNICGTLQFQTPAGTNTFTCPPSNSSFIAFTIDVSTTDTPTGVQACLPLPPGAPGRCFNLIKACDPTNVCQGITTPGGITQIWYGIGLPVGITTLIVTNSPAAGGVLDVSAIDAQNIVAFGGAAFSSGNNTATTNPVGPAITATANSLTISTISNTGTATAVAAPFTFVPLSGGDGVAYQLNSTAGITTPNWTTSPGTWSGFTATFIGGTTKPVISVAMNPTAASVLVNTTLAVTPTVTNDTAGVNLALTGANCSGATCGTLSSSTTASGVSVTYTAPAAVPSPSAVVTLTASSITDPTKTATTTITVTSNPIVVTVSPGSATVQTSATQTFSCTVTNDAATAGCDWTLTGAGCSGATCGGISVSHTASGVTLTYTGPAAVPSPATVSLTATSTTDVTKSAAATITVVAAPAIVVSVSPGSANVQTSNVRTFSCTVINDAGAAGCDWALTGGGCSGATCGTLSTTHTASGVTLNYTAPASVPSPATVTLTATSTTDGTKSAAATITVTAPPPIIISVSPGSASVQVSNTKTFSCTLTNDGGAAGCDWALTGAGCSGSTCGTLSTTHTASGVTLTYTAPGSAPSPATVTLTADSTTDPTKTAAATITVTAAPPPLTVSISPGTASVAIGLTQAFTPTVVNDGSNLGVDWTLTGSGCSGATCGTLSATHTASGVATTYTAPATVPSPATVTIHATSTTDNTKSATSTITVFASIVVSVSPGSASVQNGHTQTFTPTVTNDGTNAGVDWTLSGFSNVGPTIPVTFFDMNNDARTGAGAYPTFPIGGIRLWDPAVTGWAGSQTGPSTYNFTNLNARLSDAPSGYDIMWTAGCSPNFIASSPGSTTPCQGNTSASASLPSDVATTDATWKGFITALVNNSLAQTHHIKYYEMNNEADLTQYCFNGAGLGNTDCTTNAANLVTMVHDAYTIIHALDPSALVVSPTGSTTCTNNCGVHLLPAFFAAGGAPYIDIVGMHSYMFNVPTAGQFSNVPEQITNIISQLRTLMSTYSISSLPLWFTEGSWGGGTNNANMTDAQKVAYIGREYLLMRMGGVARNYWYAYGNSQWGTLSDGAGNLTAAGTAMSLLDSWLVGATDLPGNCTQDGSLTWQCNINRQGSPAIIIWNPTNTPAVAVSSTYTSYLTLDNTTVNPIVSHSITAGPKPVMVIANLGTLSALHTASGTPVTYTAASVVPSPATVTITATSTADATKAASSTITVFSLPIVVSVAPGTATVPVNGTQAFTPTVTNDAANAGVDWTLGSCTTFTENFNEGTLPAIWATTNATGVEGGGSFSPSHVSLSQGVLQMNVTQDGTTAGSVGAEIELNRQFGYGTYSWSMQAAGTSATQGGSGSAVSGQISSTFQYSGGNPVPTEIDSPEIEGQFPNQIEWTTWLNGVKSDFHQTTLTNPQNTYHIYKYIWAPGSIAFYLDGSLIWTSTTNVPTGPAFPITNLWGTNSTNFGGLATAGVTRYMYINNFTYSNCGTLSATHTASGTPVTYTAPPNAPSPATVTITATSTTDNTKSATSTITIGTAPNITIAVAPATASVTTNGVQNFTATLTNDTSNQGATWALSGAGCSGATCGTLSKSGSASGVPITYTAPTSVPSPATVTLTATSVTDPTKTATATITVASPVVTVTVSPASATFQAGSGSQVFTASVANSGATPAWTLSCSVSNCGSITPTSGTTTTYTPPASVTSTITVTLTATVTGPVTGTATITVNPTTGPFSCVGTPCPAFAGAGSTAMGSGALSQGGRGGVVYNVNTISDATNAGCVPNGTATCSLRDCVQATGARTCIFTVSGNISLTGRMTVSNPFLTVAGQSAPGGGIWTTNPTCTDCLWWIQTHDVVIRYIGCSGENPSIPSGPNTGTGCFLFTNANNYNDIIDHTSFRWWGNKGLIFGSNGGGSTHEVTLQWSLVYEPNIGHPVCVMFDDTDSEVLGNVNEDSHHNMLVNCDHRMPLFNNKSGRWVDNLVYDYGTSNYAFLSQGGTTTDIINNMYVGGNLGGNSFEPFMFNNAQSTDSSGGMPGPPSTFISGNVFRSDPTQTTGVASNQQSLTATGTEGGQTGAPAPSAWFRSTQLATPQFPIVPDNAINLPNVMLATVGNSQDLDCLGNFQINRNSQDQRIITQYQTNGNGAYFNNQYSSPNPLPGTACVESLHDGIPDQWKTLYGLSTSDTTLYRTPSPTGLTYLEDYLDGLPPGATSTRTFAAASCSQSAVAAAIAAEQVSPVDGDIISIPSGSCSWSTELDAAFTHSVTVQGAGAKSATTGGASITGSDATTINIGSSAQLNITTVAGKSLRVTGIAFLTSAGSPIMLFISGASTAVRVDHCHFFTTFESMELDGSVQGVADHNFFDGPLNSVVFSIAFHNGQNWNGASGDSMGNASWTDTEHWGSSQFFFAEDNNFNVDIGDGHNGARYVIRHNTMQNSYTNQHGDQMYNHGVTPDPARGVRAVEMYLNNATGPTGTGNPFLSINSGAALFWSNSMTQYRGGAAVDYYNREHQAGGNYTYSAPPNGWGYCGSANGGPTNWDQNTNSQGYACIDQPGRGAGDLLSGTVFPGIVNQTQGNVIAQPHQALVPIYSWNNTLTSAYSDNILAIQNTGLFTNNVDYYQQFGTFGNAGSFNGTAGVGQGLLSARTGTCTTGVGYWATDTTTLYVCGPTNTWTTYYTPYVYPHPLNH